MRFSKFLLASALALMTASALAQTPALRDLSIEQNTAAQVSPARPSSIQVSVAADRADATYAIGENVRLTISVNEDANVIVYSVGPTGNVLQLFPNQYQPDNRVAAGRPVEIVGGNTGARLTASGTPGTELIKVVASSRPVTVVAEGQLQARGPFRSVEGGASALTRDLQIVANQPTQPDLKVSFLNTAIYTVGARLPALGSPQAVVIGPGPGSPTSTTVVPVVLPTPATAPIVIHGQQPFPLLVALDKQAYRMGERVTLAVTSLQACNLTVFNVNASGQVRTVFPTAATPINAVGALQTVLVAGGPSANSLQVTGPVGAEQVVAVCSTDAAPVVNPAAVASVDRSSLSRDLAIVANRPVGTTAMASVTFAVQP
jgi:hypothetical protein